MGFAELIFTSLIRISAINPKSKHYVTFAAPRDVPVRRAKLLKEDLPDGNRSHGKFNTQTKKYVGQSPLVLAKAPAVIENHQFIRGRKF